MSEHIQPERVHTWRRVSQILQMTEETLKKRRKEHGCRIKGRPFFRSPEAVLAWYERLLGQAPPPEPAPKPQRPARQKPEAKAKAAPCAAIDLKSAGKDIIRSMPS